ncbi:MAG: sigma-70 family RNA polymerase sigma factor [Chloroflexota bacterium]|nr:sigma-70 family RNA polymerase sigma factor [Chloroflexota bacterium]
MKFSLTDFGTQSTQDQEQALACFLENLEPNDPQILKLLIGHYALEIYQLIQAILDSLNEDAGEDEINFIVQQVFVEAASSFGQFRGKENIRIWLFKIAISSVLAYRRRRKKRWRRGPTHAGWVVPQRETDHPQTEAERQYRAAVDGLDEEQRLCVVLRYVHNLTIPHIADALQISGEKVHTHLTTARQVIQREVTDSKGEPGLEVESHPEIHQQIQASLDGLLDSSSEEKIRLDRHLSTCPACQAYSHTANQIESRLAEALQRRWPAPVLNSPDLQSLTVVAQAKVKRAQRSNRFLVRFKEIGLLGIVLLAVIGALGGLVRVDTPESKPLFPPTPLPPPTPIAASVGIFKGVSEQEEESAGDVSTFIFYAQPSVTADGRSIAFLSSDSMLVAGDTNEAGDIFIVDRETSVIERVSVSSDGIQGNGTSFDPMVSADGRLVVFASLADNLVTGDEQICASQAEPESSCADIFVHDRETGITERITLAYDGSEADGHSLLPTISASGRWVTFWSEASNLVEGDTEVCGAEESAHNCLDIFVHDRETGNTDRIPIGQRWEQLIEAPISISDDGRHLAIVVHADDVAAGQVQLTNQTDVFIYDRHTGTFEPVNVSSAGTPGNRASMSGIISTDGRYVAFASWASNLVADDTNDQADVFVRDRIAHTTERVSVASDGSEGNGDSGILSFSGMLSWGGQVNLSDDGHHVAFTSHANNLTGTNRTRTYSPDGQADYNWVYVHDRQTGETKAVILQKPEASGLHTNLHISGDGRWISLMKPLSRCSPWDICSEIWLYDQQTGRAENLLKDRLFAGLVVSAGRPSLPLRHDSSINSVVFSPDGQTVATGASDGILRLWRVSDGTLLHTLEGHTRPVSGIAFSQDGTLLISGSRDRSVGIWQTLDGTLVNRLAERSSEVLGLAISTDDRLLALGGIGAAWIWETEAGSFTLVDSQEYPGSYVNDLAFSPDGTILALALSDETVWLRRTPDSGNNDETLLRLGGHTGKVLSLAFAPDGKYLATGSEDNTLNLWQLSEQTDGNIEAKHILTLQHPDWVNSLAFSPDGTMLASGTMDRKVRLWSVPDGNLLDPPLPTPLGQVLSVAFSPNGQTLAVGTVRGNLHLWAIPEP